MEEKKIYLVISSHGSYDDYSEKIEKAFEDENDAKAFAEDYDKMHSKLEPVFDKGIWNEMKDAYYDDYVEGMEEDEEPIIWNGKEIKPWLLPQEEYDKYYESVLDELAKDYLKILHDMGINATHEQVKQHMIYEDQECMDYHDCEIQEIVVIPSTSKN